MTSKIAFVGGIHGVGKSTICRKICDEMGVEYLSASDLIKWKEMNEDSKNKKVKNILEIQENYSKYNKPFIVNFLYAFSYPKRPNLKWLNENGVIPNILDMPRGFRKITQQDFIKIANYSFAR